MILLLLATIIDIIVIESYVRYVDFLYMYDGLYGNK